MSLVHQHDTVLQMHTASSASPCCPPDPPHVNRMLTDRLCKQELGDALMTLPRGRDLPRPFLSSTKSLLAISTSHNTMWHVVLRTGAGCGGGGGADRRAVAVRRALPARLLPGRAHCGKTYKPLRRFVGEVTFPAASCRTVQFFRQEAGPDDSQKVETRVRTCCFLCLQIFAAHAPVNSLRMRRFLNSKDFRGSVFVEFGSKKDAEMVGRSRLSCFRSPPDVHLCAVSLYWFNQLLSSANTDLGSFSTESRADNQRRDRQRRGCVILTESLRESNVSGSAPFLAGGSRPRTSSMRGRSSRRSPRRCSGSATKRTNAEILDRVSIVFVFSRWRPRASSMQAPSSRWSPRRRIWSERRRSGTTSRSRRTTPRPRSQARRLLLVFFKAVLALEGSHSHMHEKLPRSAAKFP